MKMLRVTRRFHYLKMSSLEGVWDHLKVLRVTYRCHGSPVNVYYIGIFRII